MTRYLNNDESRWIEMQNGKRHMPFVLVLADGTRKVWQADYYESFGNFATTHFRHCGKAYCGLAKAHDGSEMRDPDAIGQDALEHVWLEKCRAK